MSKIKFVAGKTYKVIKPHCRKGYCDYFPNGCKDALVVLGPHKRRFTFIPYDKGFCFYNPEDANLIKERCRLNRRGKS